jgi:hypothetical protein
MTHPESNSDGQGGLTGGGSGDGGPTGTASADLAESPPGSDQDSTMVVSGGGVADPSADDGGPSS